MANTKQGIYYQDNYNSVADVPADMKKMAESIDTELETDRGRLSTTETNIQSLQTDNTTNKKNISDIKSKNTAQDTNIATLTQRLNEKDNQIAELKAENEDLKADLSNSQIHGKASGEYVHLSDSAKMNCDIAVLGNSRQETRSGKNYFNTFVRYKAGDTPIINGIKFTFNKDGSITCDGTATADTTLDVSRTEQTISGTNKKLVALINGEYTVGKSPISFTAYDIKWQNTKNIFLTEINKSMTTAMIDDVDYTTFRIIVYKDTIIRNKTIYLQILDSSETDLTYEQYGAMPSIDYPSEIESLYSANVKVCNKNLLSEISSNVWYDDTNMKFTSFGSSGGVTSVIAPIPQNSTITVSKKNASNRFVICTSNEKPAPSVAMKVIYVKNESTQKSYTFNNTTEKWLWFGVYRGTDETEKQSALEEIQIEVSETQTDYIPHEEQNYPVDMQEPMLEGDYFDLENGKEVHNWIKYEFTGNENWTKSSNDQINRFILYGVIDFLNKDSKCNCFSTKQSFNASDYTNNTLFLDIYDNAKRIIINTDSDSYATVDDFKAKLKELYNAGTPVVLCYKAEPRKLDLTTTQTQQLQQLAKAKTYKNITNITTDTIAVLDVDYKRDLETIINNMQAQILAE